MATPALAAPPVKTPLRSDPSYFGIGGCYAIDGGAMDVPANTPLTAFGGYVDFTPEAVMKDVTDPANIVTYNGQAVNLHRDWAGLTNPSGDEGIPWGDWFFVPVAELAVGQSATLTWTFPDSEDASGTFTFTCTVTGT